MARVDAFFALNYKDIDFNFYSRNYESERFVDGGGTEWDILHVYSTFDTALSHYGWDFTLNANGFVNGGTVEAIAEWVKDPATEQYIAYFGIAGIDVDITSIFDVAQTESQKDDQALLRQVLSGKDRILLSDFDDTMMGYNGNDKIYGYAGRDNLNGGKGKDQLFGGNDNDILRGSSGDDVIRGGKGRDKEYGGSGEDRFVFKTGDDKAIIMDFDARGSVHDVLDLRGLASVRNWSDLKNNHMSKDGKDVEIDAGGGDVIVLKGVSLGDLDKGDFLI